MRGRLVRDATLSVESKPPHAGWIVAVISCGSGRPYLAKRRLGSEPGHLMAARMSLTLLRQGTLVEVYACGGTRAGTAHGQAVARLLDVTDIQPLHAPAPRHEPSSAGPQPADMEQRA